MCFRYKLRASFSKDANIGFRMQTRLLYIINRSADVKNIPIIINNYNRLEYLRRQIEWLKSAGHNNLHVIDNNSTYKPLLNFYKKAPVTVYYLDRNVGHEAFWRTHLFQRFCKSYYVLTDPDVLPDDDVPRDFMYFFHGVLTRYPGIKKVGFGLQTDDLPDHYPKKQEVLRWEAQFYKIEVEKGLFRAPIDTTFALYKPGAFYQCWDETLRTGAPYLLKHMPWYENPHAFDEETTFYMKSCTNASSWYGSLKGSHQRY